MTLKEKIKIIVRSARLIEKADKGAFRVSIINQLLGAIQTFSGIFLASLVIDGVTGGKPAESEAERLDGGYPQLSGKTAQLIIGKRLKAEYSEHGITEEELSECADAAIKLAESLYAEKKPLTKVIYRFVLCRI